MSSVALAKKALEKNKWTTKDVSGLTLVFSPLLTSADGLKHAFTTRLGAGSSEPLNWFNLGRHWPTEESREDAMNNRRKLCDAFGLDANRLTVPSQQHTNNIFQLTEETPPGQFLPEIDAVATDRRKHPVLLHFADCVPVMLFDQRKKVLCVLHAGWRGTAGGIVSKGVKLLEESYSCNPGDILAAVGPAIGSCCYVTGLDVVEKLSATVSNTDGLVDWRENKPYPDIKAFNAMQLLEAGVKQVDVSEWCTCCHPEIFYSHRQSGGKTGRQGALACLE